MQNLWGEPAFCIKPNMDYLKKVSRGDIDAFLFLFFDNFSSLLGILAGMLTAPQIACNFDFTYYAYFAEFRMMVFTKVCPGIGCALLFGNVWYAMMAAKLSAATGRTDVTALPYGINTPAGFLTVYMVMLPVCFKYSPYYSDTGYVVNYEDGERTGVGALSPAEFADKVWSAACCANFIGGLFEVGGIFMAKFLSRNVPKAALYAPVCGVGFVWLGYNPLIDVMREPLIGFVPLFFCFTGFFAAKGKGLYPASVPMALLIFLVGTILWWCGAARWDTEGRSTDKYTGGVGTGDLNDRKAMADMVTYMSETTGGKNNWSPFLALGEFGEVTARAVAIQFPIALASFIETIENVEMAKNSGDEYNVNEAMLADGLGTMFGALCGAVMPTTVYIGHKRHKLAGARWFYSLFNGVFYFLLMMSGGVGVIFYCVDQVSIGVILIAVGLMIVQQAMEVSASRHYPALMIGIMFLISDMLYFDHFNYGVGLATRSLGRMRGVSNMAPAGGIMCSLILTAILCDLTDARFGRAGVYCCIASLCSLFGLMHGNNYVFANGDMMHAFTGIGDADVTDQSTLSAGAGADIYTTDLGEVMLSTFAFPKTESVYPFSAIEEDPSWGYRINGPESDISITTPRAFNEGWRFAAAYAILALLCAIHFAVQKFTGKMCAHIVMDNGTGSGATGAWGNNAPIVDRDPGGDGKEEVAVQSTSKA